MKFGGDPLSLALRIWSLLIKSRRIQGTNVFTSSTSRERVSLQTYPKVGLQTANNWLHFIFYDQWRMRKNHWNALTIYVFGQTTTQLLSNIEPWKFLKCKQFWGMKPDLNCFHESVNFQKVSKNLFQNKSARFTIRGAAPDNYTTLRDCLLQYVCIVCLLACIASLLQGYCFLSVICKV